MNGERTDLIVVAAGSVVVVGNYLPWLDVQGPTLELIHPLQLAGFVPRRFPLAFVAAFAVAAVLLATDERPAAIVAGATGLVTVAAPVGWFLVANDFASPPFLFPASGAYVTVAGGLLFLVPPARRLLAAEVARRW